MQHQLDPRCSVGRGGGWGGGEDLVDNSIEHHPFIGALPEIEAFDVMDD